RRREVTVKVQVLPAIAGIDQPAAVTALGVENQPVPVDQQMLGEPLVHLGWRYVHAAILAHAPPHIVQTAYLPVCNAPGLRLRAIQSSGPSSRAAPRPPALSQTHNDLSLLLF